MSKTRSPIDLKNRYPLMLMTILLGLLVISGKPEQATRIYPNLKKEKNDILFSKNKVTYIYVEKDEQPVVHTALSILQEDVQSVFSSRLESTDNLQEAEIIAGTIGNSRELDRLIKARKIDKVKIAGKWEAFSITPIEENKHKKIIIAGSDSRGTAFGLLEISRLIGVSPWEWWADATPERKDFFLMPPQTISQSPSVQYRGIFINDEDWGLNPWASQTFEPNTKTRYPVEGRFKGAVGPRTYSKIFELLLRLRANSIWPAMHEVTMPFYFVEGNREMAEKYGIFIGSSHCEPLARNSATEWDLAGSGEYNYLTNRNSVIAYWTDRLKELKTSNNIFTIGMRGKHDGAMLGVSTTEEYKKALEIVLQDQADLLKKYINADISRVPQILIPYKEILDVYKSGLKVPEYVTLMWCDDNYGYISHFPDNAEQRRPGGNGVYYHASYWGRPHDYLWLGTASPGLLHQQMKSAYEKNARKIWILNVGDIKAIEYQMELFLDMAWNMKAASENNFLYHHQQSWLEREFGHPIGQSLAQVIRQYYRLAFIRKPEFMGNTREEEGDPKYKKIKDLPWSEEEINERLQSYKILADSVEKIGTLIPETKKDVFFELIKYPVLAAAQMNNKLLYAQLARHNKADWKQSDLAYDSIVSLTHQYNTLNSGKWNKMMDFQPRRLPVFARVGQTQETDPLPLYKKPIYLISGKDIRSAASKATILEGLGYENEAALIPKGTGINFSLPQLNASSIVVEVRLLPNHPVEGDKLRFRITLDGISTGEISYKTEGRSEEWKENVLRNQAVRRLTFPVSRQPSHQLALTALDEGVIIDQIVIYGEL